MGKRLPTYAEAENMNDPDWVESPENFPRTTLSKTLKKTTPRKKPGKEPKIADEDLTPNELKKRNARRERNRNAATRCREKKRDRIGELEEMAENLKRENAEAERDISDLRAELESLRKLVVQNSGQTQTEVQNEMDSLEVDQFSFLDEIMEEELAKEEKVPVFNFEEFLAAPADPVENFMEPERAQKVPMDYMQPEPAQKVPINIQNNLYNLDLFDIAQDLINL